MLYRLAFYCVQQALWPGCALTEHSRLQTVWQRVAPRWRLPSGLTAHFPDSLHMHTSGSTCSSEPPENVTTSFPSTSLVATLFKSLASTCTSVQPAGIHEGILTGPPPQKTFTPFTRHKRTALARFSTVRHGYCLRYDN